MARPQLPSLLPKPRGLSGLLAALAWTLLLAGRCSTAAPLQSSEGAAAPPMAKIYPRGSHWAVGHFMGKKSTGDFPYILDEQNKAPFSLLLDDVRRLEEDPRWEEAVKKLLRLLEANDNRSDLVLREELPFSAKNTWEAEDNSSLKDKNNLVQKWLPYEDIQEEMVENDGLSAASAGEERKFSKLKQPFQGTEGVEGYP